MESSPPPVRQSDGLSAERRFAPLRLREQRTLAALLALVLVVQAVLWRQRFQPEGAIHLASAPRRTYEFLVELNEASWPELMLLPQIGETRAQRIIALRDRCGPYQSVDQLQEVHGIGPKTVEKLRPFAFLGQPPASPDP